MSDSPCLFAFDLDGDHPRRTPPNAIDAGISDTGSRWVHLDRTHSRTRDWLDTRAGLDADAIEMLMAHSTRPRSEASGQALLMTLRGVNLNQGADAEDMISIRMYLDRGRLITIEREPLQSVSAVADQLDRGVGPRTPAGVLIAIISELTNRIAPVVDRLGESLDDLEDRVIDPDKHADRTELIAARQDAIRLHRYIKPQAIALSEVLGTHDSLFDASHRRSLRESLNRVKRYVEDIDAAMSRAVVVQDELGNEIAARTNQRMYTLTIIAAIFLPLSFLTGLMGINVGGIPWASHPQGFVFVSSILVLIGLGMLAIVRWCKWL